MFIDHTAPSIRSATLRANEVLEIEFRAGDESHLSRYTKGWLRAHGYSENQTRDRPCTPQLWDAGIAYRLPCIDYTDYMQTNAGLRAWIEGARTQGIVQIGRAHVWNSSHSQISYAVFCL